MIIQNLTDKNCVPCEDDGFPPLTREQATDLLPQVPGWQLSDDATRITFNATFKDFKSALVFVNQVGALAEEEGHHPDIAFGWGKVSLTLSTYSIGGLSENDFILGAKIHLLQS